MQLEVYVDVLFFWNVIMNLVLLIMTKCLRRQKTSGIRMILGASFGGLISCITTVLSGLPSIVSLIISYGFTGILMILIVFGKKDRHNFFNNYLYLLVVTFIFGGMMQSLLTSIRVGYLLKRFYNHVLQGSVSLALMLIFLCTVIPLMSLIIIRSKIRAKEEQCYYNVILKMDKECILCKGFLDTGNSLYDPLNGKPVILVDRVLLHSLYEEVKKNRPEKIRVIPYRCIGKENGLLEGIRFDEVTIENEQDSYTRNHITAALSEYEFKNKDNFQVLLHSELLGNSNGC